MESDEWENLIANIYYLSSTYYSEKPELNLRRSFSLVIYNPIQECRSDFVNVESNS